MQVTLAAQDEAKVVEALGGGGVVGAQASLVDRSGTLEHRSGLLVVGALP